MSNANRKVMIVMKDADSLHEVGRTVSIPKW